MKDELALIRAAVAKLEARPLAKTAADPRDAFRCSAHAAFVAACDYLLTLPGWSARRIAREMGTDHVTLGDWLKYGDQRRCQIPGWAFAALPSECHFVFIKHMLGWADAPAPSRTGTDG